MKLNRLIFSIVVATLFVFTSCTQKFKSTPLAPVNVQVNVTMDDLEYVGEVTGTSTQSYLFGVLPVGERTNQVAQISGGFGLNLRRGETNALYNALQSLPDADFVLPVSVESTKNVMFLGNKTEYTVRAKAYRIKTTK